MDADKDSSLPGDEFQRGNCGVNVPVRTWCGHGEQRWFKCGQNVTNDLKKSCALARRPRNGLLRFTGSSH